MKRNLGFLQANPLFRGLSGEDVARILENAGARMKPVPSNEYILRAGDTTSELGFVLSGSVLVIQEDLWGHRNIMNQIPAGDVFAEIFAAAGAPLNVSVVAREDSEILFVDVNRLLSPQKNGGARRDRVVRNLISILAGKTMALNEKVTHISRRSTRDKLLSYLSAQAIRQGSLSFDIAFNRQQLADYLCVERSAMSVELSRLQKDGVLNYSKNHFELKELTDL